MSVLPTIDLPTYTVKLPVSEQTIKFRPYMVKEQKILAMAKESGDRNTLIDALFQVIENCVIGEKFVRDLPITDIEFLFYNLRARSESETLELKYKCENLVNDIRCGNVMHHDLNLLKDLELTNMDISPIIEIGENVGIKLKHQKFEYDTLEEGVIPTPTELFEIISKNVDFIFDKNNSFKAEDLPLKDMVEWIGNVPPEQYLKIEHFFLNEPKIIKRLEIKCSKCGMDHDILVEDIFDFFI